MDPQDSGKPNQTGHTTLADSHSLDIKTFDSYLLGFYDILLALTRLQNVWFTFLFSASE